ncbi:hypothetical protein C0993_003110 [Termitomyces sp. T159_Od127]|nr:hypothetical protein C0993_003110 [Termitomyces sp. T159_Od127]
MAVYLESSKPIEVTMPGPSSESDVESQLMEQILSNDNLDSGTPIGDLQYPSVSPIPSTLPRNATLVIPSAPHKSNKWSDLPKRELSTHTKHVPIRYRQDDEGDQKTQHTAFVVVSGPHIREALSSSNADGWHKAIDAKYPTVTL